ncbi:RecQ family ATP-dependent DNA helicase [Psychromonas antarctica]|uniref:RecQ family ATP-dependent DNA helicase n=1 Tax=Psychromonas antarctica TaxID=67573 RepID=UPI001EE78EE5|nr:RecQ family ATP-dependent DNA helicase [Psychromonas antarctica]MCG6200522.1 RecQ family ATP-dependent DNA helicase [Psychromonas antarctica]
MKQSLKQYFGFSTFRAGQEPVIEALLNGQSAAAIFPTGSGKSLCYQLPALHLPHLTLVVSPLLALIQDQLQFLQNKGISAASIHSMQTPAESSSVYSALADGQVKILFISVERLNSERFRLFLKKLPISLLVVDEAHCISEWGHNFRPDYLKLAQYRRDFNIPQALLLTATATAKVVQDMAEKFAIEAQNITLTGSYRGNLNIAAQGVTDENKLNLLIPWLKSRMPASGIIYVTLQKSAEDLAHLLTQQGIRATPYHAGLANERRVAIQERFMSGELPLIVATIAFGMGIDKSDIRFVVHYDLPKSIENYAQEIGRAGRDGLPADCLVLANKNNLNILENFVYGDSPEATAVDYILNTISQTQGQWEVLLNSLSSLSNIRLLTLKTLLVYLELAGVLQPAYSYYAEYKYKLLVSENELLDRFKDERYYFVQAILQSSDKARTWATINFETLHSFYPSERSRVITAIDYLDQQGLIELQTKQMTQVYKVFKESLSADLRAQLVLRFKEKEASEVARIHFLLDFFASDQCLNLQLAHYFSDTNLQQHCGHCSVCMGAIAVMPQPPVLRPLSEYNFAQLSAQISAKLTEQKTPVLLARFFCGLTTPLFTRLKVRTLIGFAELEKYRFSEVKAWVEEHLYVK